MKIEHKKIDEIVPYKNNTRTHSDEQVDQIIKSIKEFGFTNPILIDENDTIIAGHGRYAAAKKMELTDVPCVALLADDQIVDFDQAQKRGLINEQYEIRKALFNEAKSGNVSALKEWMQLKENIKINEKRKNRK